MFDPVFRARALAGLAEPFDLVVVGAGITGCGVMLDAAQRGLRVLVVEKADVGSGTSSRSSKLIHGGLRYLEQYEFRLVAEALAEREVLLKVAAHLVWPARFVMPHVPSIGSAIDVSVNQVHVHHYRNPASLPPGGVLLVGSGQSGVQLAEELMAAGRSVTMAVGHCGRFPRTYRGLDAFWWLRELAIHGRKSSGGKFICRLLGSGQHALLQTLRWRLEHLRSKSTAPQPDPSQRAPGRGRSPRRQGAHFAPAV